MYLVQFIAPLRADFVVNGSSNSVIRYLINNESLVVHWEDVRLEKDPNAGEFRYNLDLKDT